MIAAALVLVTWLGVYRCFRARIDSRGEPFMLASLVLGLWIWLLCEIQSLTRTLTPGGALVWWLIAAAVSLLLGLSVRRRPHQDFLAESTSLMSQLSMSWKALVLGILLITAATGLLAWISPVMAWDALAYHIPRVFYWTQYGSVEHYPAANARQLFMGPWPAFFQMQHLLLVGSDRLANLLQWLSMVGCVVAATAIAKVLGGGFGARVSAAILVVTIPMGIGQATSALTDYTVSFFLIVFAYYSLAPSWKREYGWLDRLAAGTALGLAILCKGTAIPLAVPLLILLVVGESKRFRSWSWKGLLVVGSLAAALNAPHMARNLAVFDHPLAPEYHRRLVGNQSLDPRFLVSNLVRQSFVHLGTWDESHAQPLLTLNRLVHAAMGIDDGDLRNSLRGQKLRIQQMRRDESQAGNGLHVLLFSGCGLWLLFHRRRLDTWTSRGYSIAFWSGILLFCLLFKYQHTISRLQLPIFVLGAPWAAVVLDRWLPLKMSQIVGWVFIITALPWTFFSEARPLLGEWSVFRQSRESLIYRYGRQDYSAPAKEIAWRANQGNKQTVGFISRGISLEYYLWYELRKHNQAMPHVENITADHGGATQIYAPGHLQTPPDLIAWFIVPDPPTSLSFGGVEYIRQETWDQGPFAVFEPPGISPVTSNE